MPQRLMPWFCPKPWRVVACSIDLRPGGIFSTTMQSPEGVTLPEGPYETVAGYVVSHLGELATVGATVEVDGHILTVTELDGRRVARIRLAPLEADGVPTPQGSLPE